MMIVFTLVLAVISISIFMVLWPRLFFDARGQRISGHRMSGNTLVITAHPDDECMFFGPTIVSLMNRRRGRDKVYLLCLSIGDYYGKEYGPKRKQELYHAIQIIGFKSTEVTVLDKEDLKDGQLWAPQAVVNIVKPFIARHSISNVITFDAHGVSGHYNHGVLFHAVQSIPGITLFALESVSIIRKYWSIIDLPLTLLQSLFVPSYSRSWIEVISAFEYFLLLRALNKHTSQMVWFRKLYALFSRYMFINSFQVYK